jgi:hypothetical protein
MGDRAQAGRIFESVVNLKPDDDAIGSNFVSFLTRHFTFCLLSDDGFEWARACRLTTQKCLVGEEDQREFTQ